MSLQTFLQKPVGFAFRSWLYIIAPPIKHKTVFESKPYATPFESGAVIRIIGGAIASFLQQKQSFVATPTSRFISTLRDMGFLHIEGSGHVPEYTRSNLTDALHRVLRSFPLEHVKVTHRGDGAVFSQQIVFFIIFIFTYFIALLINEICK